MKKIGVLILSFIILGQLSLAQEQDTLFIEFEKILEYEDNCEKPTLMLGNKEIFSTSEIEMKDYMFYKIENEIVKDSVLFTQYINSDNMYKSPHKRDILIYHGDSLDLAYAYIEYTYDPNTHRNILDTSLTKLLWNRAILGKTKLKSTKVGYDYYWSEANELNAWKSKRIYNNSVYDTIPITKGELWLKEYPEFKSIELFPELNLMKMKCLTYVSCPPEFNYGHFIFNEYIPAGSTKKKQNISIKIWVDDNAYPCTDSLIAELLNKSMIRCYNIMNSREYIEVMYNKKELKSKYPDPQKICLDGNLNQRYYQFKIDTSDNGVNTFTVKFSGGNGYPWSGGEFELPIYKNYPLVLLHFIPKGVYGNEEPFLFAEYMNRSNYKNKNE